MGKLVTNELAREANSFQKIEWDSEDSTYRCYQKYTQRRTFDGFNWEEKTFEVTMTLDNPQDLLDKVNQTLGRFLQSVDFNMFSDKARKLEENVKN
jgi:hypothetical protein